MSTMQAVGFYKKVSVDDEKCFEDVQVPKPSPTGLQLLVEVKAIAMNPIDTKMRSPGADEQKTEEPTIIGWDVSGVVVAVGDEVSTYKVGDEVFYSGDLTKPGCNSQFHLVDERIVGKKPASLSHADAAALPLTSITAYEAFFARMQIPLDKAATQGKSVLIIGGAGGVGSIATQLAKTLTSLKVIATASREPTIEWCKKMGADVVVNHRKPLLEELKAAGIESVDYVFCTASPDKHLKNIVEVLKPQGRVCSILAFEDGKNFTEHVGLLFRKAISWSWELMFTRSMFNTEDVTEQRALLNKVSSLVDAGEVKTTRNNSFGKINAANIRAAHKQQESGTTIGKIVLEGW